MSVECIMAEVPCMVIRDGVLLPKSTFESEFDRLRTEDGGNYHGWLEDYGADFQDYIVKQWGRTCWHCEKRILLVYPIQPVLEKPEGADGSKYMHRACWDHLKKSANNKRRRLRYAELRDARAALPAAAAAGPVGVLGYEPQPMLALEGPNPDLAPLPLPAPAPPSSESKEAAAEAEPAEAAAGGA